MHGHILAPYSKKQKAFERKKVFKYGRINENTGIASLWAETIRYAERGSGGNIGISQRGRPITDDRLLGTSSGRYSSGNNERIRQTHETKEEIDEIVKKLREIKLVPNFNLDNAKTSFDNFVGKGSYYGNWYKEYINEQLKAKNLVRIKTRSTPASESTSPINADYGMDASNNTIPQNSEMSSDLEKIASTNSLSKADDIVFIMSENKKRCIA